MKEKEDCDMLQSGINQISGWSQKWEMEFRTSKFRVMAFVKGNRQVQENNHPGNKQLSEIISEKDLEFTNQNNLSLEEHTKRTMGEVYNLVQT